MTKFRIFFNQCLKVCDIVSCVTQISTMGLSIFISFLLILQALYILVIKHKNKGRIKLRVLFIFLISLSLSICDIVFIILDVFYMEIKILFIMLVQCMILLFFIKKLKKRQQKQVFLSKNRLIVFYIIMAFNILITLIFTIIKGMNLFLNIIIKADLIYRLLLQIVFSSNLYLLLILSILIKTYRKASIKNFKFNINTLSNFIKNQNLIASLSLIFISFLNASILQIFIALYLILKHNQQKIYVIPQNFKQRELLNSIFIFIIKVLIYYLPIYFSQKLFQQKRVKNIFIKKDTEEQNITSNLIISNQTNSLAFSNVIN